VRAANVRRPHGREREDEGDDVATWPSLEPQPERAGHDLFERYRARILAYCWHELGSREEAEDAVQTTFLQAFRALRRGVEPEAESAWLFSIAKNVCRARRRAAWRRARVETPADFQELQFEAPAVTSKSDELIQIGDALAEMPENQRRAILLREWQGFSYREIGADLGLSQAAVETLIFRARRSLAHALEQPRAKLARVRQGLDAGSLIAALKSLLAGSTALKVAATAVAVTTTVLATQGSTEQRPARPVQSPSHAVRHQGGAPVQVGRPHSALSSPAKGPHKPVAAGPSTRQPAGSPRSVSPASAPSEGAQTVAPEQPLAPEPAPVVPPLATPAPSTPVPAPAAPRAPRPPALPSVSAPAAPRAPQPPALPGAPALPPPAALPPAPTPTVPQLPSAPAVSAPSVPLP
jgi:RNA polymerase sigma factor (sigma-70 family)